MAKGLKGRDIRSTETRNTRRWSWVKTITIASLLAVLSGAFKLGWEMGRSSERYRIYERWGTDIKDVSALAKGQIPESAASVTQPIDEERLAYQCKHAYILASHMSTIVLLCGKVPSKSPETSKHIRNLAPRVLASIRALDLGLEFEQRMGTLREAVVSGDEPYSLQHKFLEMRDNMYQETQMRFSKQVQAAFLFGAKFAVVETSLITDVLMISSASKGDRANASQWTKDVLLEVKQSYANILPVQGFPPELLRDVDMCISILEKQEYDEQTVRAIKTIVDRWTGHFQRTFPYSG